MRSAAHLCALTCALALAACSPVELPVVTGRVLPDTTDATGPYPVEAQVTARRSIARVELIWHNAVSGPGEAQHTQMVQDERTSTWRAALPGFGHGAKIAYHIEATDNQGDTGYWPPAAETGTSCTEEICFQILP